MKAQRGDRPKISSLNLAFLSNLAAMLLMVLIMRPGFETNDDIVFAGLGSGFRGVKDAHLVFQNYGLGLLYRLLYQITGDCHGIPLSSMLCYCLPLLQLLRYC